MKILQIFLLSIAICGGGMRVFSKPPDKSMNQDPSRFFSIAPVLQINGYGLNFKWGHFNSVSKYNFFTLDIERLKHQKEFRYPANPPYNGFVYGRTHIAIPVSFGMGKWNTLGVRNSKNDVGVAWTWQYGVTLALLKPVYLYIDENPGGLNTNVELVRYDGESTFDANHILGGASFFTGVNQMKAIPGAFAKTSLVFSWGRYYNDLHSLEIGMMAHGYVKRLPLMASIKNNFIYPTFYLSFNLGKFW